MALGWIRVFNFLNPRLIWKQCFFPEEPNRLQSRRRSLLPILRRNLLRNQRRNRIQTLSSHHRREKGEWMGSIAGRRRRRKGRRRLFYKVKWYLLGLFFILILALFQIQRTMQPLEYTASPIFPRTNPTDPLYLDYNATTPVDPEVAKAMWPYMTQFFGNPSSNHVYGRCVFVLIRWFLVAKEGVEKARESIGQMINAEPSEILFLSGGTPFPCLFIDRFRIYQPSPYWRCARAQR